MQREQARLREAGGYAGPCSVRGYIATVASHSVGLDRVYKEHAGVRISVARSVAPKVPSIRELILQLNRKQQADQQRPSGRPARRSFNNLSSKLPDGHDSGRSTLPAVTLPGDLHIQLGDFHQPNGSSNKSQLSPGLPPSLHKPKLPWRLSNNRTQPNPHTLGNLMNIRHMTSSTDISEAQGELTPPEKFDERSLMNHESEKISPQHENIHERENLTSGVLVCSSIPQHKLSLPENAVSRTSTFAPSLAKRTRPLSSAFSFSNSLLNSTQLKSTQRNAAVDPDPEYPDPIIGAPPIFQQRISDLSVLQCETIRIERLKAAKKKSKSHSRQD